MRGRHLVVIAGGIVLMVALATIGLSQMTPGDRHINLPGRNDDSPYSNAVLVGDTLYLAGALGLDPDTGAPPARIEDEVRIVMNGMKQRLEMVDMTMDDLVSVQVFCSDLSLYGQFNAVYRTYFTDHYPARAFIGSGPLLGGGHFEVLGTAVRR